MSSKTYIELCKNNKSTLQLNLWRKSNGEPFYPSGAYYSVNGSDKNNSLISKSSANVYENHVWATITNTITASAAEYDLIWEIHRYDGNINNHCTKILVIDTC